MLAVEKQDLMPDGSWLVIPSRGRAAWLARSTCQTLDHVTHLPLTFLVRTDDPDLPTYREYTAARGKRVTEYDGAGIYGAAQTYDLIIDSAAAAGVRKLLILDDDLKIFRREPKGVADDGVTPTYAYPRCKEPAEMTRQVRRLLALVRPEVPMMSFTPIMRRQEALGHVVTFCKPMMMAYGIHVPHFRDHPEHRFWAGRHIEARCDLNLTVRLLRDGFLTAFMSTGFVPDNVNHPGGCSVYRDIGVERASVAFLKATYPDLVHTHVKTGWCDDPDVEREAPIVRWGKAFDRGKFAARFGTDPERLARQLTQVSELY